MPTTINTNVASLNAQRNLNKSEMDMNTAIQRLSSGLRINSAKDDAAGLVIGALQGFGHFVHRAFGGLGDGDTVVGVTHGNREAADLGAHASRNGEARSVILRGVDAQTRRQALDRGVQIHLGLVEVALGVQRGDVSIN